MVDPRHLFLLLAHGSPHQVARLVDRLSHPGFSFLVHVDRKTPIEPFADALSGYDVTLTKKRFDVRRRCWSMVEATEELMRSALDIGGDYRYLTLLSGADYPIKPASEIYETLSSANAEFLHYFFLEADRPSWIGRVDRYHYPDHDHLKQMTPRTMAVRAAMVLNKAKRGRHRLAGLHGSDRVMPPNTVLAGGSQWWSLTNECVRYVADGLRRREVRHYFRYVDVPDELVVQSIVAGSHFLARTAGFDAYNAAPAGNRADVLPDELFNRRYVDWSADRHEVPEEGGEPRGPATLDMRDFEALRGSESFLARKFHPERSAGLLDRIDAELLESRNM